MTCSHCNNFNLSIISNPIPKGHTVGSLQIHDDDTHFFGICTCGAVVVVELHEGKHRLVLETTDIYDYSIMKLAYDLMGNKPPKVSIEKQGSNIVEAVKNTPAPALVFEEVDLDNVKLGLHKDSSTVEPIPEPPVKIPLAKRVLNFLKRLIA